VSITKTPPERLWGTAAPGATLRDALREAMGRAHYDRMRTGMASDMVLPPWEELLAGTREIHRSRSDYLLPTLLVFIDRELRSARDDMHADLLDEGIA
jgi:hypothetical protein